MKKVLVVGAGIAGCGAAIALSRAGWQVSVLEKQQRWAFQSSGIFVYANGLVQFRELGVLEELLAAGFVVPQGRNAYFDQRGTPITVTHYPSWDGVPAVIGIKRAEMHRVLSARLESLGVAVRLGGTVRALVQDGMGVEVTDDAGRQERFDLVIGADGIRSGVRGLLWPDVQPEYSGFGVWRSVHRRPADLVDKVMMMGPGKRLGIMPIAPDQLYLFGTIAEPAGAWFDRAAWPRTMQARFSEFGGPVRPFLDELASAEAEVVYTAVEEVALPLPWHRGRVLLIGDAAHASTPFMGQGGAMAVQDAVVLAGLLRELPVDAALEKFGALRAPMCRFVQDVSRKVGQSGAGASEGHEQVLQALPVTAQAAVDGFYAELRRLAAGTARLDGSKP